MQYLTLPHYVGVSVVRSFAGLVYSPSVHQQPVIPVLTVQLSLYDVVQ